MNNFPARTSLLRFSLIFLLLPNLTLFAEESIVHSKALSGGEATIFDDSINAFGHAIPDLTSAELRKIAFGNKIFNNVWIEPGASVASLTGLGPLFNRKSCSSCHFKDGRGKPPTKEDEKMASMLIRLSVPGANIHGGPKPHPAYGDQFNSGAISGILNEGEVKVKYRKIEGKFDDGGKYVLIKPEYQFVKLNYGKLGKDLMISPRVAPAVFGLGLLEAIAEEDILLRADEEDKNHDGISGKANFVWDEAKQALVLGRFGWKANSPSITQQNAAAALGDIGLTSDLFPKQNCAELQSKCQSSKTSSDPELKPEARAKLDFYISTLAVPARREPSASVSCLTSPSTGEVDQRSGEGDFLSNSSLSGLVNISSYTLTQPLPSRERGRRSSSVKGEEPSALVAKALATETKNPSALADERSEAARGKNPSASSTKSPSQRPLFVQGRGEEGEPSALVAKALATETKNPSSLADERSEAARLKNPSALADERSEIARRGIADPQSLRGEEIFNQIGCGSCHVSKFTTGKSQIKQLSYQVIHPYTDMLLHDMGEELADNRPDFRANGREWRTPPLWGIGLVKIVNGHSRFLHDGRARNLEEAILWHHGEGESAKNRYLGLSKSEREGLIKFLGDL